MQLNSIPMTISNATFKGSFKIEDLDALIADFETSDETISKPAKKVEEPKAHVNSIAKTYNIRNNDETTKVNMYASAQWAINKHLPSNIKRICKEQHIHPTDDLFVVQGLNEDGKRYTAFSSFFKHPINDVSCAQIFYLESSDDKMTQLQKNMFKIFRDVRNKGYLTSNSDSNPFAKFSNGAPGNIELGPTINSLASISREPAQTDLVDENGEYRPIIYTADGQYVRYKVYTTLFDKI